MPQTIDAELLYIPPTPALRFLPEGPYPLADGKLSWVAIQHGADSQQGSLNVYDLASKENREHELPGRPGFAFPTSREGTFIVGMERQLALVEVETGKVTVLADEIDSGVPNTIINDGVCFAEGLIFGCKDLEFKTKKAGLYYWRSSDQSLTQLRNDQICSNGKIMLPADTGYELLDIDTPTKTVTRYQFDPAAGTLSEGEVALDLDSVDAFPDGMIATPDGSGVIISFYNPNDVEAGETRQYRLADGELETIWRTPASPRNTCPQLIKVNDSVRLVITTAVEHMSDEERQRKTHAGCLFIADTPFSDLPATPAYDLGNA